MKTRRRNVFQLNTHRMDDGSENSLYIDDILITRKIQNHHLAKNASQRHFGFVVELTDGGFIVCLIKEVRESELGCFVRYPSEDFILPLKNVRKIMRIKSFQREVSNSWLYHRVHDQSEEYQGLHSGPADRSDGWYRREQSLTELANPIN